MCLLKEIYVCYKVDDKEIIIILVIMWNCKIILRFFLTNFN